MVTLFAKLLYKFCSLNLDPTGIPVPVPVEFGLVPVTGPVPVDFWPVPDRYRDFFRACF